jgi:hypothetical protein
VNDDFKVLFELLETHQEVAGRAATTVPADVREKIARFAAGTCSDQEREQMKKLLREQPDLIPLLVAETRALRPTTE